MSALLEVENLRVTFSSRRGLVEAVRGVGFSLQKGERLGIVGESGSGKTMTGRAVLGLVRPPGEVTAHRLMFDGINLADSPPAVWRKLRGKRMAMVMQDPKFSLNPVMTAGRQIAEVFELQEGRRHAREKTLSMLEAVHIRDSERVFDLYPHELSGGMGQRVMMAMMLAPQPDLLIADEPTSALDVTVRMQVLAILDELISERGMGLIFISHDLNLVASFCDRVLIMYAGRVVESCNAKQLFEARHSYTRGLLASLPSVDSPVARLPVLNRSDEWLHAPAVAPAR